MCDTHTEFLIHPGMKQHRNRPVILLVAEAVTLAHFARIATLARALDPFSFDVVLASDPRYINLDRLAGLNFQPIRSIPADQFSRALARGKPLYKAETLTRYVEEDLTLIDRVRPDLVVGDFRLSLSVSAPLRQVPYASVVNAYWSPYADISYPVPDIPMTRILGVGLAQKLFDFARPLVFAAHAQPLNRVRRRFGLPALGDDLRKSYTWGDYTLYADIPEMVPTRHLPLHHRYLGPVLWSTDTPLPEWWDKLPEDKPVVFLTLGSSGRADLLPAIVRMLAQLPVTVIVATAARMTITEIPPNIFLADYLPMEAALRRSHLLICNGGSLTTYQALTIGVPVIGICSNMDQLLNMDAVERLGAGAMLRAGCGEPEKLLTTVRRVIEDISYTEAASDVGVVIERYDTRQRFRETVAEMLC